MSSLGHGWRLRGLTHGARPDGVSLWRRREEGVWRSVSAVGPVCDPVGIELAMVFGAAVAVLAAADAPAAITARKVTQELR
jgi:hypothetical protein